MVVVADSSPLIVLVKIGYVEILPKLFGDVLIPPAVAAEIAAPGGPPIVRQFASPLPGWLKVKSPTAVELIPDLHPGESEALSLAIELSADLILIDERRAYRAAIARNLNAAGTVRVLERAAAEGLLHLRDAFDRLKHTDFWISHSLLDERLRLFEGR